MKNNYLATNKEISNKKILVALSGGVDSSVAAGVLVNQGFAVIGIHFLMWKEDYSGVERNTEDLKKVVKTLGINLEIVDIKEEFKKWVVSEFIRSYQKGLTPNPCVICNKKVKFNLLLKIAEKLNCDYISTGHYAQVKKIKYRRRDEYALIKGFDEKKDQSYFLYRLNQEILSRTIFPNGEHTKEKTRELARKFYLPTFNKAESQEICFIADNLKEFLKRNLPDYIIPGEVVDTSGQVIGEHYGLPFYTEGQRHGYKIFNDQFSIFNKNKENIQPFYVITKDIRKNQLVVGPINEAKRGGFEVENVNWVREVPDPRYKLKVKVKIRNTGNLLTGRIIYLKKTNSVKVLLENPQIGVSPGQSAVFYRDSEVLGGGVIRWQ